MAENGERLKVQANPAKSFFVSMLIKDITLRDAIGDLVDNAVDAIKARGGKVPSFRVQAVPSARLCRLARPRTLIPHP